MPGITTCPCMSRTISALSGKSALLPTASITPPRANRPPPGISRPTSSPARPVISRAGRIVHSKSAFLRRSVSAMKEVSSRRCRQPQTGTDGTISCLPPPVKSGVKSGVKSAVKSAGLVGILWQNKVQHHRQNSNRQQAGNGQHFQPVRQMLHRLWHLLKTQTN